MATDVSDRWIVPGQISGICGFSFKRKVYISLGSQDLSKNLNRVGGIDLGVEIYQNDHINVRITQRTFWKLVFTMFFDISGRLYYRFEKCPHPNRCHRPDLDF